MVLWLGEGDAYALLGELLRAEYGLGVLPAMARGAGYITCSFAFLE